MFDHLVGGSQLRRQLPAATLVDGVYSSALRKMLGFDLLDVELKGIVEGRCALELLLEAVQLVLSGDLMLQLRFAKPGGMAVEFGDVAVEPGDVGVVCGTDLEGCGMLASVRQQQGWKPSTSDNRLSNCISRGRPRVASVEKPTQYGGSAERKKTGGGGTNVGKKN